MLPFKFKFHNVILCLLVLAINTRKGDSSFSVHRCSSVDSRPSSKTFQTNLKLLLSSLTSKAPSTFGFHSNSVGESPDRVYGVVLCRGDVAPDMCSNCLMNITGDVVKHCMDSTQGFLSHDYCLLRYNDREFFGAIDTDRFIQNHNQTRQDYLVVKTRILIHGLVERALSQPSMFAAGKLEVKKDHSAEPETGYGLVQCSRDLSTFECGVCLNELMKDYKPCCEGMRRWCIIAGSCSVWHDDRPFFFSLTYSRTSRVLTDKGEYVTYRANNRSQPVFNTSGKPYTPDPFSPSPPPPTAHNSENGTTTVGARQPPPPPPSAAATPPRRQPPPPPPSAAATPPRRQPPPPPPSAAATPPRSSPVPATPHHYSPAPSPSLSTPLVRGPTESPPTRPSPGPGQRKKFLSPLISIGVPILGVSIFIATMILIFPLYRRRANNRKHGTKDVEMFLKNNGSLAPKRYKYSELKKMTNCFKDKIGQGGYGGVFKGKLPTGHLVAVKVLTASEGNGQDFINEVASIGKTYHINVVSLLGFCFEGSKRALVYEYMKNGSLEKYIYPDRRGNMHPLGWEKLYKIVVDVARGLEYLHLRCSVRILHLDIKPHNILLDEDFRPKISDFGLAKLCSTKDSFLSTLTPRGTMGYTAPEVHFRNFGGVSYKSDVYSYGMMVLEMVGGRKNLDIEQNTSQIYFPQWIYMHLNQQGNDIRVEGLATGAEIEMARKMILVGLWCIQMNPVGRPSMSRVIEMFQGSIEDIQMPPNPFPPPPS